jgi:hypothetical protein
MLFIRRLKYGDLIDASFFVKDGSDHVDMQIFRVGDTVNISVSISLDQFQLLHEMRGASPSIQVSHGPGIGYSANLRFRVVEVAHFLLQAGSSTLRRVGHNITIEAEDWLTDDLIVWLATGVDPKWARTEDDED